MIYFEVFQIIVLLLLFIKASITDLREGYVSNRHIVYAFGVGLLSAIPYYSFYAQEYIQIYISNLVLASILAIMFFCLGVWGAGDSKLLIVTFIILPARLYVSQTGSRASCFSIISLIFIVAYIYIIAETICIGVRERNLFRLRHYSVNIKECIRGFLSVFLGVNIVSPIVLVIINIFFQSDALMFMMIQFLIVLLVIRFEDKVTWKMIVLMSFIWTGYVFLGFVNINTDSFYWEAYLLVIVLYIVRIFAQKYNYKLIPVTELKKGMILAVASVVMFSGSRIKGLPTYTTEDMKARLSEAEVDNIIRWSKSKNGSDSIVIVRKIPFVVFIMIGTILYIAWKGVF